MLHNYTYCGWTILQTFDYFYRQSVSLGGQFRTVKFARSIFLDTRIIVLHRLNMNVLKISNVWRGSTLTEWEISSKELPIVKQSLFFAVAKSLLYAWNIGWEVAADSIFSPWSWTNIFIFYNELQILKRNYIVVIIAFVTVAIDLIVLHIRDFLNNIRHNGNGDELSTTHLVRLHWAC